MPSRERIEQVRPTSNKVRDSYYTVLGHHTTPHQSSPCGWFTFISELAKGEAISGSWSVPHLFASSMFLPRPRISNSAHHHDLFICGLNWQSGSEPSAGPCLETSKDEDAWCGGRSTSTVERQRFYHGSGLYVDHGRSNSYHGNTSGSGPWNFLCLGSPDAATTTDGLTRDVPPLEVFMTPKGVLNSVQVDLNGLYGGLLSFLVIPALSIHHGQHGCWSASIPRRKEE